MSPTHRVRANGIDFTCHVRGDGPRLALLLHGFPDDAGSMLPLAERLAVAGFTAVAPFMRGYAPTGAPVDGQYGAAALAHDVVGLIDAFSGPGAVAGSGAGGTGAGSRRTVRGGASSTRHGALVIGHDWGAVAGYAAANLDPARVERLVALSVPPVRTLLRALVRSPAQARRSAYMGLFQLPWLAEILVRRDDFAFVRRLWRTWSPGFTPPPGRLDDVVRTLSAAGTLPAALGYYRALGRPGLRGRAGANWRLLLARVRVPTLVVAGDEDGCIGPDAYAGLDDAFAAPRRLVRVPGAGHFLPLEAPDRIAELIAGWRTN